MASLCDTPSATSQPRRGHGLSRVSRQVEVAGVPSVSRLHHVEGGRVLTAHTGRLSGRREEPCCAASPRGPALQPGSHCSVCQVTAWVWDLGFCCLSFLLLPRRASPCLKVRFLPKSSGDFKPKVCLLRCEAVTVCGWVRGENPQTGASEPPRASCEGQSFSPHQGFG